MAYVNPGPRNNALQWCQPQHRSAMLFKGNDAQGDAFDVRRGDQAFWSWIGKNQLYQRVKFLVRRAGFSGVLDCGYRQIDRGLITALVERWRPETHTFHLRFGEATVSLEDVNVLMGLPINGTAVIGPEFKLNPEERLQFVANMLGIVGEPGILRGNTIGTSRLPLPADASEVEITQRARCVISIILGCSFFCDTNNGYAMPEHPIANPILPVCLPTTTVTVVELVQLGRQIETT